jgi:ribosomal protein S18 acetylase RimI-like enzyme
MARMPPEEPLLSPATAGDEDRLAELIRAAFEEHRGRFDPPSGAHKESGESIREHLKVGFALLAFISDQPVGCVLYRPMGDHVYLSRLGVLPEHRRRGVGRRLMDRVEERARELGIPRVKLGVRNVLPDQRAYYERRGYRFHSPGFHPGVAESTFAFLMKELPAS